MDTLRILIADDHPIFLKGLREVLESEDDLQVVACVSNGQEALLAAQTHRPDVAVLDIDMPRLNGLEAADKILHLYPQLPVVLLTMHKDRAPFMRALEIGVLGYVLKENAVTDVIHAIHSVRGGNPFISPEMSAFLLRKTAKPQPRPPRDFLDGLTPAEVQIIRLVAQYKSSQEIADLLFISEKTVSNHRLNITRKLNLTGKNALLRFAIENLG